MLISSLIVNCQKSISGIQYSKIPILNLWTNWGKRRNLHKISIITFGKWNFKPIEHSAHTNWPLEKPYYVYKTKTVFFQTHAMNPYVTIHKK